MSIESQPSDPMNVQANSPSFGWARRIKLLRQSERSECGLACLAMIANFYGHEIDLHDLRLRFQISVNGVRLSTLIRYAESLNLQARALRAEDDEIRKLHLPCILHFDLNHFVVLTKVKKKKFYICDPAEGFRTLNRAQFSAHFTGVALELQPTQSFSRGQRRARPSIIRVLLDRKGVKRAILNMALLSFLLEVISLISPLFVQGVVDKVIGDKDMSFLGLLMIGFGLALALQAIFTAVRSWVGTILSINIGTSWSDSIFSKLLRLPDAFFQKRHMGDITSRFNSLDIIQQTFTSKSAEVVIDGTMACLSLCMILFYSKLLALATVVAVCAFLLVRLLSFDLIKENNYNQINLAAKQQTTLIESIRGAVEVKLNSGHGIIRSRYLNRLIETNNATAAVQSIVIFFGLFDTLIFGLLRLIILGYGAEQALRSDFTAGMLVAFLAYNDQFIGRATSLVDFLMRLKTTSVHVDRVAEIALTEPERDSNRYIDLSAISPSIEFRNVSFRYSGGESWVLRDCSFSVRPGERVYLIGASGSGKSTIIKLICGLLEPLTGTILIGGVDLSTLGVDQRRLLLGTVMQDSMLFSGPITDNVSFFDTPTSSADVERVCAIACIDRDISSFPMRYHTLVGDMGSSLSGGQRQRVCIARAIYRKPKALLLDEATCHLDITTERQIMENLRSEGMTELVVSHRADFGDVGDRVLRVTNGAVVDIAKVHA